MRRRGWIAGVGMLIALGGCATSPAGVEVDRLAGRWQWESASGGIAGRTITPATEGYTLELRLTAGGGAQLLRNGAVAQTATYELGVGEKGGTFVGRDVVRFTPSILGGWEEMGVVLPDPNHLVLADGCCDGFTYGFVRIGSTP